MNSRQTTDFTYNTSSSVNKSTQNYENIMNVIRGDLSQFKLSQQTVLDNQTMAAGKIVSCEQDCYSAYFKDKTILNK